MVEICLEGLSFFAYHGLYEAERTEGNTFEVDISVKIEENSSISSDEISNTIDYEELYSIVKNRMEIPVKLLETLAITISNDVLEKFLSVNNVYIRISKLNPPIKGNCTKASVVIRKTR